MGPDAMILVSKCWVLSQLFHSLSLSSGGSLVLFLPQGCCHLYIRGYWYFSRQSWFQLVLLPVQRMYVYMHVNTQQLNRDNRCSGKVLQRSLILFQGHFSKWGHHNYLGKVHREGGMLSKGFLHHGHRFCGLPYCMPGASSLKIRHCEFYLSECWISL